TRPRQLLEVFLLHRTEADDQRLRAELADGPADGVDARAAGAAAQGDEDLSAAECGRLRLAIAIDDERVIHLRFIEERIERRAANLTRNADDRVRRLVSLDRERAPDAAAIRPQP